MLSRAAAVGLYVPTQETALIIGAALGAHWVAARAAAKAQFWGRSPKWLGAPRHYLNRVTTPR